MAYSTLFAGKDHAQIYKTFRPSYSEELFCDIWPLVSPWIDKTDLTVAVDVGCGSGQATEPLSSRFDRVIGVDPSISQLEEAKRAGVCSKNGDFIFGSSELLPLKDNSCNYIQAFEAAHWFNLPKFYKEVDRVLKPGGVLLLGVYSNTGLEVDRNQEVATEVGLQHFESFNEDFYSFFNGLIKLNCLPADIMDIVQTLYRDIKLPYPDQIRKIDMRLKEDWTVERYVAYLSTWSGWQIYTRMEDYDSLWLEKLERKWKDSFGDRILQFTWPFGVLVSRKPL